MHTSFTIQPPQTNNQYYLFSSWTVVLLCDVALQTNSSGVIQPGLLFFFFCDVNGSVMIESEMLNVIELDFVMAVAYAIRTGEIPSENSIHNNWFGRMEKRRTNCCKYFALMWNSTYLHFHIAYRLHEFWQVNVILIHMIDACISFNCRSPYIIASCPPHANAVRAQFFYSNSSWIA